MAKADEAFHDLVLGAWKRAGTLKLTHARGYRSLTSADEFKVHVETEILPRPVAKAVA